MRSLSTIRLPQAARLNQQSPIHNPQSQSIPLPSPIFTKCKWGTRQSGASGAGGHSFLFVSRDGASSEDVASLAQVGRGPGHESALTKEITLCTVGMGKKEAHDGQADAIDGAGKSGR